VCSGLSAFLPRPASGDQAPRFPPARGADESPEATRSRQLPWHRASSSPKRSGSAFQAARPVGKRPQSSAWKMLCRRREIRSGDRAHASDRLRIVPRDLQRHGVSQLCDEDLGGLPTAIPMHRSAEQTADERQNSAVSAGCPFRWKRFDVPRRARQQQRWRSGSPGLGVPVSGRVISVVRLPKLPCRSGSNGARSEKSCAIVYHGVVRGLVAVGWNVRIHVAGHARDCHVWSRPSGPIEFIVIQDAALQPACSSAHVRQRARFDTPRRVVQMARCATGQRKGLGHHVAVDLNR